MANKQVNAVIENKDGSTRVVIPSEGGFNPVLTTMALGYWVGEHIVREWRGGGRFRA